MKSIVRIFLFIGILLLSLFLFLENSPSATKQIIRLDGRDRYETAINICQQGWPGGLGTIVIARGDDFPDALSGVPFAFNNEATILLTNSSSLNPEVVSEIKRLKASKAYILGSLDAISDRVERDLSDVAGISFYKIFRMIGMNRYETAISIANNLTLKESSQIIDSAIVTSGENYPDALSIGAFAAAKRMPILLVSGQNVNEYAQNYLKNSKIKNIIIVGGEGAVSTEIENWFRQCNYATLRLGGKDRYETCKIVSDYALSHGMEKSKIFIATGENFPDALTLGSFAAKFKGIILLVKKEEIPPSISEMIQKYQAEINEVYLAGGEGAISKIVENKIKEILKI